ncbi:MAG: hypothetical protein U1F43_35255 [Myxococcota bacterium]
MTRSGRARGAALATIALTALATACGDDGAGPELPTVDPSAATATPVMLGDRLVLATAAGLASHVGAGTPTVSIEAGGRIVDAVAAAAPDVSGAALFAVVDVAGLRRLSAFSASGASAWDLDAGGGVMRRPGVRGDHLMVVSSDSDGSWQARWVDRNDGSIVASLDLGAGPATPPARLRSLDTQWLVGVDHRLVALEVSGSGVDTRITVVADIDAEVGRVTSVFSSGVWLIGATGWLDAADADAAADGALGDRLIAGGLGEGGPTGTRLLLNGHPMATPDLIEAPPVLVRPVPVCVGPDCTRHLDGVIASGGSHWLGGWRADIGQALFVRTDLPERVTGVAFGDNGRLFSGGSHWLPGSPQNGFVIRGFALVGGSGDEVLLSEDFALEQAPDELVVGVPSPIVQGGSLLVGAATTHGPLLVSVPSATAAPTPCGWPRAFGDDRNAASPLTDNPGLCGL